MMRAAPGEVSEWSKEHAWKVCIRKRIEGSNPSLSAILWWPLWSPRNDR